jgi:hypothetical protein
MSTCFPASGDLFMGIGIPRTGYGTCPQGLPVPSPLPPNPNGNNFPTCAATAVPANQNYNAFLNLDAMQSGKMTAGYILTQAGIKLGLTASNTMPISSSLGTYAFEKLVPTGDSQVPGSPPDWQVATGTVDLDGNTNPYGEANIDTGISNMLIGPATPTSVPTAVPTPFNASVTLLGLPAGTAGYTFTSADVPAGKNPPMANNPMAPTGVQYSPYDQIAYPNYNQNGFAFVNTGIDALNGFDELYDAQNGYIGLQLNTSGTTAFLTPTIGANYAMSFPEGFVTDLPIDVLTPTTLSTTGTITLNGPVTGAGSLSGAGQLTIAGGTVHLNCPSTLAQTTVTQGTLVLGSTLSGPVTTQGSGKVKHSPNHKCGSMLP